MFLCSSGWISALCCLRWLRATLSWPDWSCHTLILSTRAWCSPTLSSTPPEHTHTAMHLLPLALMHMLHRWEKHTHTGTEHQSAPWFTGPNSFSHPGLWLFIGVFFFYIYIFKPVLTIVYIIRGANLSPFGEIRRFHLEIGHSRESCRSVKKYLRRGGGGSSSDLRVICHVTCSVFSPCWQWQEWTRPTLSLIGLPWGRSPHRCLLFSLWPRK